MRMPSGATLKKATLVTRLVQFVLSMAAVGIFTRLLAAQSPNTPTAAIGVLLGFVVLSTLQTVAATVLTLLEREGLWLAAFDLVCICGFVTGAVMDRALTDKYHCRGWLTRAEGDLDTPSVIARAAVEAKAESELWPESSECAPLRGVFGIAISQCVMLVVSFQLVCFALRARKMDQAARLHGWTEKRWRADSAAVAGALAHPSTREGRAGRASDLAIA